jgi:hypothetical protein
MGDKVQINILGILKATAEGQFAISALALIVAMVLAYSVVKLLLSRKSREVGALSKFFSGVRSLLKLWNEKTNVAVPLQELPNESSQPTMLEGKTLPS